MSVDVAPRGADAVVEPVIDVEVTNRCNADCYFCPRDQTPHQGLMTQEVFERTLARVVGFRDELAARGSGSEMIVSLCGLGEPLVNPRTPHWARAVKEAGFTCVVSSNGSLLDERRGRALIDAGVDSVWLNVGDIGEAYEEVYRLPWERTRANVVRFAEMAEGRCGTNIVLVDHRGDPAHTEALKQYWRDQGIRGFMDYDVNNRGGSLFVDHMQFDRFPQLARARRLVEERGGRVICATPFIYVFVGYDGRYYLCSADWRKEASFGSVADRSILELVREKLEHVLARRTVCRTCNIDPVNHLAHEMRTAELRGEKGFDAAARAGQLVASSRSIEEGLEELVPGVTTDLPTVRTTRPLGPLVAE
jgi:MoaA/NifB/PqqE/SkfB family radical SAM enzyme